MFATPTATISRDPGLRLAFVLDDEPEVGACVGHALVAAGFVARQFSTPSPFLAELQVSSPELIVLDLALGQSDAVEMLRHLKEQNYSGKIILISGRDVATLVEIKQIGERYGLAMLQELRKPFRAVDLVNRLSTFPGDLGATRVTVDVAKALSNGAVELSYQQKVDLRSQRLCGAEILLCARHPRLELMSSIGFSSLHESLNQQLFEFALRRAMADWGYLSDKCNTPVALNIDLPASVMQASNFLSALREHLPNGPRFPGLTVNVNEPEFVRDLEWAHEIATQLKLYNVRVSIKSSGSDSPSLMRLFALPCAEVKLDGKSAQGCSTNPLKRVMCQTIINLAHRFGISVCAEGAETAADIRTLGELGCDTAQGSYFGKPVSLDRFAMMLRNRATTSPTANMANSIAAKPRLIQVV